jgi:hypothetical protein
MASPVALDLPIIQKAYDLVKWYIPILNRLPRDHRFTLGERMINGLYDLLEGLMSARYITHKLPLLEQLNHRLDLLRHQTRLLLDFSLIDTDRYEYIIKLLHEVGSELGGWIKQQRQRRSDAAMPTKRAATPNPLAVAADLPSP